MEMKKQIKNASEKLLLWDWHHKYMLSEDELGMERERKGGLVVYILTATQYYPERLRCTALCGSV